MWIFHPWFRSGSLWLIKLLANDADPDQAAQGYLSQSASKNTAIIISWPILLLLILTYVFCLQYGRCHSRPHSTKKSHSITSWSSCYWCCWRSVEKTQFLYFVQNTDCCLKLEEFETLSKVGNGVNFCQLFWFSTVCFSLAQFVTMSWQVMKFYFKTWIFSIHLFRFPMKTVAY